MWGGVLVTPVRSGRQPGKEALSGEGDWKEILPEKEGRIRGRAVGCNRNQPSRQNGEKLWDTDGVRALQKGVVAGEGEGFAGLGSDVHKVQRDIRDWREEEAGTRYLKRAEEMKKPSGCAELGQAQTRGRERSDQPGEREEMREKQRLRHQEHTWYAIQCSGASSASPRVPATVPLSILNSSTLLLWLGVPAGIRSSGHVINHHLAQRQIRICYKKLEVICISLSDLWA